MIRASRLRIVSRNYADQLEQLRLATSAYTMFIADGGFRRQISAALLCRAAREYEPDIARIAAYR